jgi:hypothetical protein
VLYPLSYEGWRADRVAVYRLAGRRSAARQFRQNCKNFPTEGRVGRATVPVRLYPWLTLSSGRIHNASATCPRGEAQPG